jgi:hypothetical protein
MKDRNFPLPKIYHSKKEVVFTYEHLVKKKQKLLLNCYYAPKDILYRHILQQAKKDVGIFLKLGYKMVFNHAKKDVILCYND